MMKIKLRKKILFRFLQEEEAEWKEEMMLLIKIVNLEFQKIQEILSLSMLRRKMIKLCVLLTEKILINQNQKLFQKRAV